MMERTNVQKTTILITGIAGLIGSNFARHLLNCHPEVHVIGLDACYTWGNDPRNVPQEIIDDGDMFVKDLSKDDLTDVFERGIDVVYHFASYAAEGLSPYMRKFNYYHNTISTANLLNFCISYQVQKIVYTSSMSVYGPGATGYFDEDDVLDPQDPYAISKYGCEMDIKHACEHSNLRYSIVRPHNVFGPYQNINDKYRNVIGIWMHQILEGSPMTIYGSGDQTRMFTYVDNILEPLYKIGFYSDYDSQTFNLGGLDEISINEAAETLSLITGYDNIVHLDARGAGEVKYTHPLPDKSVWLLGYRDSVSFIDGLELMWNWVEVRGIGSWYKWDELECDEFAPSYFRF